MEQRASSMFSVKLHMYTEETYKATFAVTAPTRSAYKGTEKKLVLAFDIGTTFSGVAYSILDHGEIPEIRSIHRYPAQETGGASKIPTVIYYDQAGDVRAVGAETLLERVQEQAEDEGWVKAAWFKLHMCPKSISNYSVTPNILALPPNKSVIDIFADFMKYLYECAKAYIEQTSPIGPSLWTTVQPTIEYVFGHPNGWEGAQQQYMRRAAVLAGLVPDTSMGHMRLRFVTEGEASLHFCIQKGLTIEAMKNGEGILIIDAGGGTIDISAYGQSSETNFEEIAAAQCHLQGSVFVTDRARVFLNDYLKDSTFLGDVERMATDFDQSAKHSFDKANNPLFIRFGGARDRDPTLGIRGGQLKLPGADVVNFFQPSVTCILDAVLTIVNEQEAKGEKRIATVFLVGGFASSPYLYAQIQAGLECNGIHVCRPDCQLNKAVAEGALSFYLDRFVNARVSKVAYGVKTAVIYDDSIPSHRERRSKVYVGNDGKQKLPNAFRAILPKGIQILESQEFRRRFYRPALAKNILETMLIKIIVYRGTSSDPQWTDIESDQYTTLCQVEADTSQMSRSLTQSVENDHTFYMLNFEVILSPGLTELAAQIAWEENDIEKRSPANIVWDDFN